jgi:hypothetical protein
MHVDWCINNLYALCAVFMHVSHVLTQVIQDGKPILLMQFFVITARSL